MPTAFNPLMLVVAREAAGLTQVALAHDAGISQGLLSKIENGLEDPSPGALAAIAGLCDVPVSLFEQPETTMAEGIVDFFHRKRRTLPAKPLRRAHAQANLIRLEAMRLTRGLEFNDLMPLVAAPPHEGMSPSEAAAMTRAAWRVPAGPLPDLIGLIEATGIPVVGMGLGHEKLSAISMPGKDDRHVIVYNTDLPASAQRFTLAHEVGHLILHYAGVADDLEGEADEFASALLMPAEQIGPDLRGLAFRDLAPLKQRWHVSMAALMRSAHDLGYISDRQYRTFNIKLNQLPGGRKHEPAEFDREQPRLVRSVIDYYRSQLSYSLEDVARQMVVTMDRLRTVYMGEPTRTLRAVSSTPPRSLGRSEYLGH